MKIWDLLKTYILEHVFLPLSYMCFVACICNRYLFHQIGNSIQWILSSINLVITAGLFFWGFLIRTHSSTQQQKALEIAAVFESTKPVTATPKSSHDSRFRKFHLRSSYTVMFPLWLWGRWFLVFASFFGLLATCLIAFPFLFLRHALIDITGLEVTGLSFTFVAVLRWSPMGIPLCLLLWRYHMLLHFFQHLELSFCLHR